MGKTQELCGAAAKLYIPEQGTYFSLTGNFPPITGEYRPLIDRESRPCKIAGRALWCTVVVVRIDGPLDLQDANDPMAWIASDLESGARYLTITVVAKLAKALSVKLGDLLD